MDYQFQTNLNGLLQLAIDQTPPEELPEIVQLWRDIRIPTLREIIRNPAYCPSNENKANTLILPDESGHFHEYIEIGGQQYDVDSDLLYKEPPGRHTARHDGGFFTPKEQRTDPSAGLAHIVACKKDPTHYARGTQKHCRRPGCPICSYYQYIQHKTPEQMQKLEAAVKDIRHNVGWKYAVRQHVEISPPKKRWLEAVTPDGAERLRKEAEKHLMAAGFAGGLLVEHWYRQNGTNDSDVLPQEYVPEAENDGDKHAARFGPHFHALGMGYIDPIKVKQIYEKTGWVIKALRTGKNTIKNAAEMSAVLVYIKSHACILSEDSPRQYARLPPSINWFGACSRRKQTRVGSIREFTPQICPECGEPLHLYDVHGTNNDITDGGVLCRPFDFPIYGRYADRGRLRALLKEYRGDPLGLLGELDKNPKLGVCVLSRRQLIHMSAPMSVKCLDGSLHCIESDYEVRICEPRKSQSTKNPEVPPEIMAALPCFASGTESPEIVPVTSSYNPGLYIDYHLPPEISEASGVYE